MQLAGTLEMCWRWIQYLCLHNKVYSHQVTCTFSSFSTAGEFFLGSGSVSHRLGPLLDSMANVLVLSRSLIRHVFIMKICMNSQPLGSACHNMWEPQRIISLWPGSPTLGSLRLTCLPWHLAVCCGTWHTPNTLRAAP